MSRHIMDPQNVSCFMMSLKLPCPNEIKWLDAQYVAYHFNLHTDFKDPIIDLVSTNQAQISDYLIRDLTEEKADLPF